jgi:hypothetical protein
MAYMTAAEVERNLKTVMLQDTNTVRFELLKTLFVNTSRTFVDEIKGSLTIQPLANGDGTVYPPVLGSESEADDTHHLETNYATSSISDTNNPYATIRDELEEHFGANQGGSNIVVFINPTATAKTEALTGFVKYADKFVVVGSNTATVSGLPTNIPGRIIGRVSGCWVSEWRWIPDNYMAAIHMEAPAPIIRRVDPPDTGLPKGLTLKAENEEWPLKSSQWTHRFGFGVGNRLNGVVLELATGGSYTIPTIYQ